jgi:hypothetical protein
MTEERYLTAQCDRSYQVSVKASGFQAQRAEHLTLDLLRTLRQDFTLSVHSTTESVTVTAASPIIQTENQTLSMVVDDKQRFRCEVYSQGRQRNTSGQL